MYSQDATREASRQLLLAQAEEGGEGAGTAGEGNAATTKWEAVRQGASDAQLSLSLHSCSLRPALPCPARPRAVGHQD